MKVFIWIIMPFLMLTGCDQTNVQLATEAGVDVLKAVTLSDSDVRLLAREAARASDKSHRLAGPHTGYGKRLARIVGDTRMGEGFNVRVYLDSRVNAFAMADGSIRIYSGLMDKMDDRELVFIMGHEMGHVVEHHIRKKMIVALSASAVRKGLASQENLAGFIASSALGELAQALTNAQFSQKEEEAADDFGFEFLKNQGFSEGTAIAVAAGALEKLAGGPDNHSLLSSHPHPLKRAQRIRSGPAAQDRSWLEQILATGGEWLIQFWDKLGDAPLQKENGQ